MTEDMISPIRIMIIDDHQVVREGLTLLIKSRPGFEVTAQAENSKDSLVAARREQPDVILLDLDGAESGLDLLPQLLQETEKARVLVLTGVQASEMHHKAMMLGAMGVVQKDKSFDVLLKAIEKVHAGEIWYDRSKMGSIFTEMRTADSRPPDPELARIASLTRREAEIITLISLGMKNKAIGGRLFISETTVRHHLTSIFEKLGVTGRLELIIYALSRGLAKLPDQRH